MMYKHNENKPRTSIPSQKGEEAISGNIYNLGSQGCSSSARGPMKLHRRLS